MLKNYLAYGQIALLIILVSLAYGHTLDAPFYLDDFSSIQENPVIYNWQGTLAEIVNFAPLRTVGYLTFATNYQIDQFQVAGYHLVNIIIHLLAGLAVWGFTRGLIRTPMLNSLLTQEGKLWLPLVVSLLFLLHPLQTQAVTYIVQRLASLVALFYITAMACFLQARLAHKVIVKILWISGCVLATLLAFLTKENAFTLPFAFILLERIFFSTAKKRLLIITSTTVVGTIFLGWLALAWILKKNPFSFTEISLATQAFLSKNSTVPIQTYALTQLNTFWTYLRLFFMPIGLHIDYDYPLNQSLWAIRPLLALVGHLLLLSSAFYGLRKWLVLKNLSKQDNLFLLPLTLFGILFYYLAHAVESSIIPINDVIFEHRTYLPNLGLCLASSTFLLWLTQRWRNKDTWIGIAILIICLGTMTWFRNQTWRDPVVLWSQNVEQAPNKHRARIILGKHYIQANESAKGLEQLEKAVVRRENLDGSISVTMTTETLINIVVALRRLERYDEALARIDQALHTRLRPFDKAKFLVNQGNIFVDQRKFAEAETAYREAIVAYPQNINAQTNLANILLAQGYLGEAKLLCQKVLHIDPNNMMAKQILDKVFEYERLLQ